ncbi:peroxidase P7-like [Rutidosis leptorrhynchoides]|uniref:peroxidase P7-like n=1 Tax=Rutidosis leptorrhynchoides TaxID=125765 RepID=UPI003A99F37E
MASRNILQLLVMFAIATSAFATLSSTRYYNKVCPKALPTIKAIVKEAVKNETRMAASLLRLHFHDCFVQGCDGSILLDSTATMVSEKEALPNKNSARGFEVIDKIKAKVDEVCGRPVVSCADILAVAARDSVVLLGGSSWDVRLGRKDSTIANATLALFNLPNASLELPSLLQKFEQQGLNAKDLVVLSGGHTLGVSQCRFFRPRIYNDTNINRSYAKKLQGSCPQTVGDGDTNLEDLDSTAKKFDVAYFKDILKNKALLHSDQVLVNNRSTASYVKSYSNDRKAFFNAFGKSMIKMGNIGVLTDDQGEVRSSCRIVNSK